MKLVLKEYYGYASPSREQALKRLNLKTREEQEEENKYSRFQRDRNNSFNRLKARERLQMDDRTEIDPNSPFSAKLKEGAITVKKYYMKNKDTGLKESKTILDYDINLAEYIYDNIDVDINRHGYLTFDEDVLTYENVIDYYDDRITKKEFKNTKSIVVKALQQDDLKFYTPYNSDTLIELSDNHTLWEINVPIDEEEYGIIVEQYLEEFTQETGVEVFTEGRSGRHICVHNTVENLIRFEELQTIQQKLESEMIDYINTNYDKENINEDERKAYNAADKEKDSIQDCNRYELITKNNNSSNDSLDEAVQLGDKRGKYNIVKDYDLVEDITNTLEDLGYIAFSNSKGGYYISRKFEKNLQKAKDYLDNKGIDYTQKTSRGRIYLDFYLPGYEPYEFDDVGKVVGESYSDTSDIKLDLPEMAKEWNIPKYFPIKKMKDIKPNKSLKESVNKTFSQRFNESLDFVKKYLNSLKVDNKIRSLKNNEKAPKGFSFKSSTSKEGEVTYKGINYAWAIIPKTKELKVMKSSDAGNNWSETIFNEYLEEDYYDDDGELYITKYKNFDIYLDNSETYCAYNKDDERIFVGHTLDHVKKQIDSSINKIKENYLSEIDTAELF